MKKLKAGTVKRLHVDRRIVARNVKLGQDEPSITIQTSKGPIKARAVRGDGLFYFVQSMNQPLRCGARLWIETHAELEYT